ncbi:MAG: S-layer homology domain-containing protein, partial [Oscillospiraceae bacterium]
MNYEKNRLYAALLSATIFLSGLSTAYASGADLRDVSGHWAEPVLIQAYEDSLIEGYNNRLNPDELVTKAEAAAIICRVLSADVMADISGVSDVSSDSWYYEVASKSVALGLLKPAANCLGMTKPMTRHSAL